MNNYVRVFHAYVSQQVHPSNILLSQSFYLTFSFLLIQIIVKLPSQAKPGSWLYFRLVTTTTTTLTQILPERVVLALWNFACGPQLPQELYFSPRRGCPWILKFCMGPSDTKIIRLHPKTNYPPFFTPNPSPSVLHSQTYTLNYSLCILQLSALQ